MTAADARPGLVTLDADDIALRSTLETIISSWATDRGASCRLYPPLIDVADLADLDYFRNFPQLGVLTSGLHADAQQKYAGEAAAVEHFGSGELEPARYALPSAACFNAYLALRDSTIRSDQIITTVATCFRREREYHSRRLLAFTMREIVFIGSRDHVLEQLAGMKSEVMEFSRRLGLPLRTETSSDPFFEADGARALMAKLFPVKEEFVYSESDDPVAIGSVNFHRNFFGERCRITLDDHWAFTGCVAFGLERWISVLREQFGAEALPKVRSWAIESGSPQ